MTFPAIVLCVVVTLFASSHQHETSSQALLSCKSPSLDFIPRDWITMADPCTEMMKKQVNVELSASMTYFAMGAHFSKDTVNRPGFAKMFFESASEEREHAIKIIGYLLMRGNLTEKIHELISDIQPMSQTWVWTDGLSAIKDALILEAQVTRKIRDIAFTCETSEQDGKNFNDYHLVDWLTGDFLTEQYEGQRDLAGKMSNLGKMMKSHGALGEFLFDKKLLSGTAV